MTSAKAGRQREAEATHGPTPDPTGSTTPRRTVDSRWLEALIAGPRQPRCRAA